jgi:hypothetical protein
VFQLTKAHFPGGNMLRRVGLNWFVFFGEKPADMTPSDSLEYLELRILGVVSRLILKTYAPSSETREMLMRVRHTKQRKRNDEGLEFGF